MWRGTYLLTECMKKEHRGSVAVKWLDIIQVLLVTLLLLLVIEVHCVQRVRASVAETLGIRASNLLRYPCGPLSHRLHSIGIVGVRKGSLWSSTVLHSMSSKRGSSAGGDSPSAKRIKASSAIPIDNNATNSHVLPHTPTEFQVSRARVLTKQSGNRALRGSCVVYWMFRDQRVFDNHALHYAESVARAHNVPLRIAFNLLPGFLGATLRQYGFMLKGLKEVEATLRALDIPFDLLMGDPVVNLPQYVQDKNAMMLVADFSPLRSVLGWATGIAGALDSSARQVPMVQVDAHNVVPCWVASNKLEYSARTLRSKITPKIAEYLRAVPAPTRNAPGTVDSPPVDWEAALAFLPINRDVKEIDWLTPGPTAAMETLERFLTTKLKEYGDKRNDPNLDVASNLSPYIHFGHISVEKVLLMLKAQKKGGASVDSFVEESVVRRELADNFCFCKCLRRSTAPIGSH